MLPCQSAFHILTLSNHNRLPKALNQERAHNLRRGGGRARSSGTLKMVDSFEQGSDEELESSEESDEGSDFDEDACSASEHEINTDDPLTEEEINDLIDKLFEVESKAADAQETLEEESLAAMRREIEAELAVNLSGSELDAAVEEELLTFVEQWQKALDKLEDESGLLQERLDDAGIELSSLFKWMEEKAPQCCSTEAWRKRTHWAGLHPSEEVSNTIQTAESELELRRPVKRHRGKLIEEGASGYLEKKVLDAADVQHVSESKVQKGDGWESLDSLLENEGIKAESSGFGSKAWASVYLAATPEQAARLGLPGADEVEEIVDLEGCKKDFYTATALASEKESGLTELQKKNLKRVGEEDDIKRARLIDRFFLKRKRKNRSAMSNQGSETGDEKKGSVEASVLASTTLLKQDGQLNLASAREDCIGSPFKGSQDTQNGLLKRHREDWDLDFPRKRVETDVINIDSDEEQVSAKSEDTVFCTEQAMVSIPLETDIHKVGEPWSSVIEPTDTCGVEFQRGKTKNLEISDVSGVETAKDSFSAQFMCTMCAKQLRCDQVLKHPLFDVVICRPCRRFYLSGPISKDASGRDNECSWCANGGDIVLCDGCDKVFCGACIQRNFGEQELERILETEEWRCYCCNYEPLLSKIDCFMKASELGAQQSSEYGSSESDEPKELREHEKRRKRLRRILEDDELEESTKIKQRLEKERKERLDRLRENASIIGSGSMLTSSISEKCAINIARDADEEEVLIPTGLAKFLKPHQIEGVQFMWENCIESIKKVKAGDPGNGCIVAHSMGLGKTLQVIAFLYTVLKRKDLGLRTALIVTPVNVLHNWPDEFEKWKPAERKSLRVYVLDETSRHIRRKLLRDWQKFGGVMMIGYSTFRTMSLGKYVKDAQEKDDICKALQIPGPDILVCDEAHMIKNKKADVTQALKHVRTQRRIALTGSPLQNNLMEYYCMVDFVREGFLGRPQDFKNRFQNPIENGQHADSTEYDVRCMKERTHVLHKQLMGFVQRKGANVVEKELPKKFIYVISVRLSQLQHALYNKFIQLFWLSNEQSVMTSRYRKSLFPTYHALSKVWNHPDLLFTIREDKEVLSDDSMDEFLDDEGQSSDEENVEVRKDERRNGMKSQKKTDSDGFNMIENLDWCKDLIDTPKGMLEDSGKLVLLLDILSMSSARGEKTLVFSQSIPTLNLIENFLEKIPHPKGKAGWWRKDKEWYRLDGHTKARDRQNLVKRFNNPSNSKVQCVLISTKAGSLGINLQAANRVIILDGSWNPTHDIQALFRAWRFGQKKPVVVYRLLAYGTAEEKIYKRQVAKEGLAARVLDAQQVVRHSKMEELKVLFKLDDDAAEKQSIEAGSGLKDMGTHMNIPSSVVDHDAPEDDIMTSLLIDHRPKWIVRLHQHDTLLVDREDEKLTTEEEALAWEKFKRITENADVDWVRVKAEGETSTHVHNSWANTTSGAPSSSCSAKFHAELLASSSIRNNEYIKCENCQQSIGWEHIVKGKQARSSH
ncbi:hypothetical protein GOP47_0005315 [Adiantum capillus-veneris]|uniref:ATP-dependent helicase ATRX n=1 Tax=Adiantum capillus-veneris TaxID=13818 RepID=A0A9D4V5S2_ADICA|nr:hypothetical protein GOP47_0005315 [Adiantum capillus-veneris]